MFKQQALKRASMTWIPAFQKVLDCVKLISPNPAWIEKARTCSVYLLLDFIGGSGGPN